jgi:hypothetical protein
VRRLAGATLIPVDDREALLERSVEVPEERRLAQPRPAVQEDQRRVGNALATDHRPLIEPTEEAISDLGDAVGEDLALRPAKRRRLARMPHESPNSATPVARRVSAAAALAELVHRRGLERASEKPVTSVARTEDR